METARIYRLDGLSPSMKKRMYEAQREAARAWTLCRDLHLHARQHNLPWPTRDDLQRATKGGQFALHSQTIYIILAHDCLCKKGAQGPCGQTHLSIVLVTHQPEPARSHLKRALLTGEIEGELVHLVS